MFQLVPMLLSFQNSSPEGSACLYVYHGNQTKEYTLKAHMLLLLLSHISRVRLYATP